MEKIENYREKVNICLKEFLDKKFEKDKNISPCVKELIENIMDYTLRAGKRIRPLIVVFAYKCFNDDDKVIKASLAIELMQSYLLIHDDIIDKSDLRRGKPTIHKVYEKKYGDHLGMSMAILAGDLCSSYMYDTILESEFDDKEKVDAIKYLGWIHERENYGQALDTLPGFKEIREKDIWKIYELKTATYTMQGPIYLGCVLAGADEGKIKRLQEYAYNVGIGFQIQDDINGLFGDINITGKPNVDDAKEGKKTLLIVRALEMCNDEEREFILEKWGNSDIKDDEIERIREIVKDCGALDYCKEKLNGLIEKGKNSIKDVELKDEGKKFLLEMADYVKSLC